MSVSRKVHCLICQKAYNDFNQCKKIITPGENIVAFTNASWHDTEEDNHICKNCIRIIHNQYEDSCPD
jgi:hypothetical protein